MNDPVGQISAQLKGRGIVLPRDNEWLNACVECFTSSNPNLTQNQLFDLVFEQWTLADLNDVRAPSLPPGCAGCTKMKLTGKYAVQINYFLNVAVSLNKQLQKIRRPDAQNNLAVDSERQERDRDGFKSDAVRKLKMEITDGVTTVLGFEDQPIPAIKHPVPGEKAVLTGPIEVRKGVLMLKPGNVTMMGGEVDTLLIKNAPENLLARALNQEENPDPYGVNPALRDPAQQAPTATSAVTSRAPPRTHPAPTSNVIRDAFDDGDDEAMASLAEALENDSFHMVESPVNTCPTSNHTNTIPNSPAPATNHPRATPTNASSTNVPPKPSKITSSQKLSKQPSITAFLTQPKKSSCSQQVFDISSEIDDGFDDDFELIAAQTASLAEQRASKLKNVNDDPEKLKKQLEATYAATNSNVASNCRIEARTAANPRIEPGTTGPPIPTAIASTVANQGGKPPDPKQPNKRKDPALECDIFGRPKIPRSDSSASSSEAQPFRNPRHALTQDELMDSEELYDWLPPPPKANLAHVRPSHEKGKILVDYTDPSTLDLDLVSTQKNRREPPKPQSKPAIISTLEEPFPPKEFPCTRTTRGKVAKVVNQLKLRDAKWVLSAIVEAKGIELEMDFSTEALDKIFTVTAEEITRQKELLKKNPELKEKFNAKLRESQKRIQTLNCEMTIHFKNFISKPVVLDVSKND